MTIKPRYTRFKLASLLCCTSLVGLGSSISHAAGFAIIEQSVSGLGNAYAGAAARAEDASTIYFNPAGMTFLSGRQAIAGLHIIKPSAKFSNNSSSINTGSGDGGEAGTVGVIPNLYYVMDINEDIKFGLGIGVPFGLSTEYDKNWRGRYQAVKSAVSAININPSLAFKANEQWSFGLGLNLQYIEAELTNAVDFGTICVGLENGGALPGGTCNGAGLNPQASDGFSKITGDDWGVGFNLGIIYSLSNATRIGLAYRSEVKQNLDGKADFTLPATVQAAPLFPVVFADSDVSAKIDLPDTTALSAYHQINNQWALLADITWTGWSSFKELKIEFDNPNKSPSIEEQDWDNSTRYSLAVNFMPDAQWTYRAGLAFDETPIPNDEMRTARIPGSDRTWLAFGAGYAPTKNFRVEIAYVHIFVEDAKIDRVGPTADVLRGSYESSVDILSAEASWVF